MTATPDATYSPTPPLASLSAMPGSTWVFRAKANCGPENLASGMKQCENDECDARADHIVEDSTAIYFVCDQCVSLIPDGHIIKSNVKGLATEGAEKRS
jgi:hypothetical protein